MELKMYIELMSENTKYLSTPQTIIGVPGRQCSTFRSEQLPTVKMRFMDADGGTSIYPDGVETVTLQTSLEEFLKEAKEQLSRPDNLLQIVKPSCDYKWK
jgi:hypothetical protein